MTNKAIFANGCFWCTEAIFQRVDGVQLVRSGYTGGTPTSDGHSPTYEQVASGNTGHAEAVEITFDPQKVSYTELLNIFWKTHDPTTLNRQGADVGTQYRSAIFYLNDEQKTAAERSLREAQEMFEDPIVTEITPASTFYEAEEYHKDFYNRNRNNAYCRVVIDPKLKEFQGLQPS
jgi:peptide-methionine (S)-S-oxide reductase